MDGYLLREGDSHCPWISFLSSRTARLLRCTLGVLLLLILATLSLSRLDLWSLVPLVGVVAARGAGLLSRLLLSSPVALCAGKYWPIQQGMAYLDRRRRSAEWNDPLKSISHGSGGPLLSAQLRGAAALYAGRSSYDVLGMAYLVTAATLALGAFGMLGVGLRPSFSSQR